MLVESEIALRDKPFEIAEATEFSGYNAAGGRLPEAIYNKAQEALQEKDVISREFRRCTEKQAQFYATHFKIRLTPKHTFLYCFLREEVRLSLCDQWVFAETLLMTKDFEKHSEFTLAYPNIFRR